MKFWKVKVLCGRVLEGEYEEHLRAFILAADTSDQAMFDAVKYAEGTAAFGADWRHFTATEAASVELPIEVR